MKPRGGEITSPRKIKAKFGRRGNIVQPPIVAHSVRKKRICNKGLFANTTTFIDRLCTPIKDLGIGIVHVRLIAEHYPLEIHIISFSFHLFSRQRLFFKKRTPLPSSEDPVFLIQVCAFPQKRLFDNCSANFHFLIIRFLNILLIICKNVPPGLSRRYHFA